MIATIDDALYFRLLGKRSQIDSIQNGMREKAKRQFLLSLLWVDSQDLPVLPHEIETAKAREDREFCLIMRRNRHFIGGYFSSIHKPARVSFLEKERRKQSVQIEIRRKPYVDRIRQFSEQFLLDIVDNRNGSVDKSFEDFCTGKTTLGYNLIRLLLDRLMSTTSCTNWEKIPVFYEHLELRCSPWEASWVNSETLKEMTQTVYESLLNGEQLIKFRVS